MINNYNSMYWKKINDTISNKHANVRNVNIILNVQYLVTENHKTLLRDLQKT
jgi:hypothetical protein